MRTKTDRPYPTTVETLTELRRAVRLSKAEARMWKKEAKKAFDSRDDAKRELYDLKREYSEGDNEVAIRAAERREQKIVAALMPAAISGLGPDGLRRVVLSNGFMYTFNTVGTSRNGGVITIEAQTDQKGPTAPVEFYKKVFFDVHAIVAVETLLASEANGDKNGNKA